MNLFTVAKSISNSLAKKSVAARLNGELVDMATVIDKDAEVEFITADTEEGVKVIRHSTAHLMAHAVTRLYKDAKVAIGPAIENGFYYDFDIASVQLSEEDLPKIEEEMKKIVKENIKIERIMMTREEAIKHFEELGEIYKVEIIKDIAKGEMLSFYKQEDFMDLCRGPHVPSTGYLKVFKLNKIAGAYWRGNSDNKMLQRIYGLAFATKQELKDYLHLLEEAAMRSPCIATKSSPRSPQLEKAHEIGRASCRERVSSPV